MKKTLLFTLSACTLLAGAAHAVTLATFDFTGGSLAATTQDFGTSSDLQLGAQYEADAVTGTVFNTSAGFGTSTDTPAQQALFLYTVSGLVGNERLTLDSITLTTAQTGGLNSFRITAYAAGEQASAGVDPVVNTGSTDVFVFDQNTSNYTELQNGDSLLVGWGARDGGNPPSRVDYDDLILSGTITTVIPEPSSTALLGLGFAGLLFRRKRCS
ncbi:PEP-CTERM sorting domain-containing protein [Luteolibacter sp. AS25]|uniref:PEP-CTERM sorting domain-containing protein n=1 Tax=Luteolibacter sp. AS25 TaxID=3135776 RepID=UPI00398B0C3F